MTFQCRKCGRIMESVKTHGCGRLFENDDEELLKELAETIKQKHGLKNIEIHYEDLPKPYWYIETQLTKRRKS